MDTVKKLVLTILGCGILMNCGGTSKVAQDSEAVAFFTSFVDEKSFEFVANRAHPMVTQSLNSVANSGLLPPGSNAGAIDLIANPNFVKVFGDSVSGSLPFYGERQFGAGYNANTGIEFKGIPTAYEQTYNAEKERFEIDFQISEKTEVFQVSLMLFSNKSATVSVTSTHRNSIRYTGNVETIKTPIE